MQRLAVAAVLFFITVQLPPLVESGLEKCRVYKNVMNVNWSKLARKEWLEALHSRSRHPECLSRAYFPKRERIERRKKRGPNAEAEKSNHPFRVHEGDIYIYRDEKQFEQLISTDHRTWALIYHCWPKGSGAHFVLLITRRGGVVTGGMLMKARAALRRVGYQKKINWKRSGCLQGREMQGSWKGGSSGFRQGSWKGGSAGFKQGSWEGGSTGFNQGSWKGGSAGYNQGSWEGGSAGFRQGSWEGGSAGFRQGSWKGGSAGFKQESWEGGSPGFKQERWEGGSPGFKQGSWEGGSAGFRQGSWKGGSAGFRQGSWKRGSAGCRGNNDYKGERIHLSKEETEITLMPNSVSIVEEDPEIEIHVWAEMLPPVIEGSI